MKAWMLVASASVVSGVALSAAQGTWTGEVTAELCAAQHMSSAFHGSPKDSKDCAEDCLKGGGKLVFVSGGKVYQIANQDARGLKARLGERARVSGDLRGDAITIATIDPVKRAK